MNKQQVIDKLHKHLQSQGKTYQKWEIKEVVDPLLSIITEELNNGNTIRLSNFGKFAVKHQKSRPYYNINTRKTEQTSEKRSVIFTLCGRFLKPQEEKQVSL